MNVFRPSRSAGRPPSREASVRRRRARLLAVVAIPGLLAISAPATASAAPHPARHAAPTGTASATQLSAATYPGVQLIEVDFTATLTVPEVTVDGGALNRLRDRLILQVYRGVLPADTTALLDALCTEIEKRPLQFLKPAKGRRTTSATLSGFGTGWVATPDGYIVTAAHVINPDPAEIKSVFASAGLKGFIDADSKALVHALGGDYTDAQLVALAHAFGAFDTHYLTVSNVKKDVSVQRGVAVAGFKKSQKGQPVEVVSVGESYPGKDVAVLKIDGQSHLPTLPLGKNEDVSEGNTLYVAGYPAASTFFSGLSKDSEVQPTITQGPLTAVKSNTAGTPIFQTQAPASPGNSGGPVLNEQGHVIGILVASAVDNKGVALEGQEFVIPASVITEKLSQVNVTPRTSDTTTVYNLALDAYYKHYYKQALPLFQKASNLYPGHPYVSDYISQTQSAIDAGKDETPPGMIFWLLIGGGILVVVLLVVGLFLLLRRKKKRGRSGRRARPARPVRTGVPPARAAGSVRAAGSAGSAGPVRAAGSAGPVRAAGSAGPVRAAGSAGPVRAARPAGPVRAARPAGPVRAARPAGPVRAARPAGPVRAARPAGPVRPARPAGPVRPARPAGPTGPVRAARSTGPVRAAWSV